MKFEKIVAFGDSFVWGDELIDPDLVHRNDCHTGLVENTPYREQHSFVGLLAAHYNVPGINLAWPGSSLQSALWTYCWWRQNETTPLDKCLLLVGNTAAHRTSFYNPGHEVFENDPPWHRYVHSAWVTHSQALVSKDWQELVKKHMVLTDSAASRELNYLQSIYFWEGIYSMHAAVLQFATLPPPIDIKVKNMVIPGSSLQSLLALHTDSCCAHGHPNEKGHQIIRDLLINQIDHAIM